MDDNQQCTVVELAGVPIDKEHLKRMIIFERYEDAIQNIFKYLAGRGLEHASIDVDENPFDDQAARFNIYANKQSIHIDVDSKSVQ